MTMTRMVVGLASLLVTSLALSGCGTKKPEEAANAGGKVVAGSISDAMIDLDRSRAEAPLAGPGAGSAASDNSAADELLGGPRGAGGDEAGAGASDAPAAAHEPASKPASAAEANGPAKAPEPPKPVAAAPAKPAVAAPAKPKVKPAFRKPTDDAGA